MDLNGVRGMPLNGRSIRTAGVPPLRVLLARRTHQFLERDGVDEWGSVLSVKVDAPEVLRAELAARTWRGEHVAIGTATNPYQPLEGRYRVTRRILAELARARRPRI